VSVAAVRERLLDGEAVPRLIGMKLGAVNAARGELEVDTTVEATPSVFYDAVVVPSGKGLSNALAADGRVLEFLKDQYRHCKPILVLGDGQTLLQQAGIPAVLPSGDADPGLVVDTGDDAKSAAEAFVAALEKHRHFDRETDPPRV
jgi:catalase